MSVENKVSARADFMAAWLWVALGLAMAIGAWRMDRLESRGASLYTAPGLVPGALGCILLLFGLLLALRAARAGGHQLRGMRWAVGPETRVVVRRVGAFLVLALGYAAGLVGHGGIPFWLATFVFVTLTIVVFDWTRRQRAGQIARGLLMAGVIGAVTAFVVSYVFQDVFLVRLP